MNETACGLKTVPKKTLPRDLGDTLKQVLSVTRAGAGGRRILDRLTHLEAHFELDNDTALVSPLVAHLEDTLTALFRGAP